MPAQLGFDGVACAAADSAELAQLQRRIAGDAAGRGRHFSGSVSHPSVTVRSESECRIASKHLIKKFAKPRYAHNRGLMAALGADGLCKCLCVAIAWPRSLAVDAASFRTRSQW